MSKKPHKVDWSIDLEQLRVRAGQFVTEAFGSPAEVKTANLQEERAGAKSARVEIEFSVGSASLAALPADAAALFQAQLRYTGEYEFTVRGGEQRIISLRQRSDSPRDFAGAFNKAQDLHWQIELAQNLPLQLRLKGGVGKTDIDLSQLQVKDLKLEAGLGAVGLRLPALGAGGNIDIQGGVGAVEARIPADWGGTLNIKSGVGEVNILLAPAAALRLQGQLGLGRIDLPESLRQVASGRWETAAFASAQRPSFINYTGGIGNFKLRMLDAADSVA